MTIFVLIRGGVVLEAHTTKEGAADAVRREKSKIPTTVRIDFKVKPVYLFEKSPEEEDTGSGI